MRAHGPYLFNLFLSDTKQPKTPCWKQQIQEATASEPLTLEEEYENQQSWRESHDKLTFILCHPATAAPCARSDEGEDEHQTKAFVEAGQVDTPEKMIGDINFFIYPSGDDEEENGEAPNTEGSPGGIVGEIDIMIASHGDRGKGLGRAAVSTFLYYIWSKRDAILNEYARHLSEDGSESARPLGLKFLMAKIRATNERSIALFKGLGFEQEGEVNYFGEVKLVMRKFDSIAKPPEGYEVVRYSRSVD